MHIVSTIIIQLFKDKKVALLVNSGIVAGLILLFASFMPVISERAEDYEALLSSFPPALTDALGIETFDFATLEAFLSVEFYSIMWPIIMISFVAGLAAFMIAGEIENGTIEHILATPIPRWKIFLAKYIGGVEMILVFTAITAYFSVPAAILIDIPYSITASGFIFILTSLFSVAVFSIGMLFSATFSERGKAALITSGILAGMYAMNIVSTIVEQLEWLQYGSFFYYFDYEAALVSHSISGASVAVFVGTIILASAIGGYIFTKRDITT